MTLKRICYYDLLTLSVSTLVLLNASPKLLPFKTHLLELFYKVLIMLISILIIIIIII